jgi:hypothetical protein
MRVRRHRSFRPTLDVLPSRIAPSGAAAAAATTAAPSDTASYNTSLTRLFQSTAPYTATTKAFPRYAP